MDEFEQMTYDDDVYYRLYRDKNDEPRVVTMQWSDELDYDQGRFLTEDKYDDEAQAHQALARLLITQGAVRMTVEDALDIAHQLRTFGRAYPEDVFTPPSRERLMAVHEWLVARGGTLDGISAHVMRVQAVPRFIESAEAIENLAEELREAWNVIDALWGEMPANEVNWLRDNRPNVVNYCKRVHMKLWHPE